MNLDNRHYIKSLDTFISSKVIFTDYQDEDTVIKLFDEYQIKWFNQQTDDDLHDYFLEVIEFYKAEEAFLCHSSDVLMKQGDLGNGYNYGIIHEDMYANFNQDNRDDGDDMWIKNGWKNNYGVAVYKELERVLEESDRKYNLKQKEVA